MLFLLLLCVAVAHAKVCVKTFEERSTFYRTSGVSFIETKMNDWLDSFPSIEVINAGVYGYSPEYGGYVTYRCESRRVTYNATSL